MKIPNDFSDLGKVERRLLDFEPRYEQTAKPFEWKFTRRDLAICYNASGCDPQPEIRGRTYKPEH